jgi:hypothetical protein
MDVMNAENAGAIICLPPASVQSFVPSWLFLFSQSQMPKLIGRLIIESLAFLAGKFSTLFYTVKFKAPTHFQAKIVS